ncbi:MAG: hypothetical protein ACNA7E_10715, partial [Wenzhouxiangellaceae bacterium]
MMRQLNPLREHLVRGGSLLWARLASSRGRLAVIGAVAIVAMIVLGVQTHSPDPAHDPDSAPTGIVLLSPTDQSGDAAAEIAASDALPVVQPALPAQDPAPEPAAQAVTRPSWTYVQVARGDTLEV